MDRSSLELLLFSSLEDLDAGEQQDRNERERQGNDITTRILVLVEEPEDDQRRRLRVPGDLSTHDQHGADLPDRARGRERDAVEQPPPDVLEGHAEERLHGGGAKRPSGLLL